MSETNKLVTVVSEGSRLRITIWQPFIGWGEPMINNECAIENRTSGRWQQMTTTDADCLRNDLEQPIDGRYLHAPYRSIAPRNRNVSVENIWLFLLGCVLASTLFWWPSLFSFWVGDDVDTRVSAVCR